MPSPESERVSCPDCGKGYRWQPTLVGQSVTCKQCGTAFEVPSQPGQGMLPKPADDDGLYELAGDPDEEIEQPPAYVVPKSTPTEEPAPPPTESPTQTPATSISDEPADTGSDDASEPIVHVSEAKKAARREEQRIAAAEMEAQGSWRDYKWLIIIAAVLVCLGILYGLMLAFSDAMEEGLHKTMLHPPAVHASLDPITLVKSQ